MHSKTLSFVIPTLNEEKTIERTLQSLAGYLGPHEIILSDGMSKDKTLEIAKKYTNKILVRDPLVKQTIAGGRNAGAAAATGDYLVFVDADVVIPDINVFFDKAFSIFEKDTRIVALAVYYKVFPEMATVFDRIFYKLLGLTFFVYDNILHIGGSGGEFQMMPTEIFRKVGGFNSTLPAAEDMELFHRLNKIGRTHFERSLAVYHTSRRAHVVGWPKLLSEWIGNTISVFLFKKPISSEWKEIR